MQTEIPFVTTSKHGFIRQYLRSRIVMSVLTLYGIVAIVLYEWLAIDLFPPCVWYTFFHIKCPGCGLTTALLHLLHLDILAAYETNPLLFVLIPLGFYLFIKDIRHDYRQYSRAKKA